MSTDESDDHCGYRQKNPPKLVTSFVDDAQWGEDDESVVCLRDPWTDHDRCIWHAEVEDKPADALVAARANGPERLDGAYMVDISLGNGIRRRISFAKCSLCETNLSGADLRDADLSGADLRDANLSGADLQDATLPGAEGSLQGVDLSGADLRDADLSEANLRAAVLTGVLLGDTNPSTAKLDHRTRCAPQSVRLRFKSIFGRLRKVGLDSATWTAHARDAHTLTTTCSEEGLISQARAFTVWERHARRYAALSDGNILTWFGSWLNWQATGYGISVGRVSRNMILLFLASTLTYLLFGIQEADDAIPLSDLVSRPFLTESVISAVYFSVVTFTTAPPSSQPVSVGVSQGMAMVETFLGTLLIVLLGYVLGHREQI